MSNDDCFRVRNADGAGDDGRFIVEAFDSTLPYLNSIGSGEQWGSNPFSKRSNFIEETTQSIEQSERYRHTGEGDPLCVFIVEIKTSMASPAAGVLTLDNTVERFLPVGAATV